MTHSEEGPFALPRLVQYMTTCYMNWTRNFLISTFYSVSKKYKILNYHPLISALINLTSAQHTSLQQLLMFKAHSTESNYISNTKTQFWSPRQDPHLYYKDCWQCSDGNGRGGDSTSPVNRGALREWLPVCILLDLQLMAHNVTVNSTSFHNVTPTLPVVYRGGWFGDSNPPEIPKISVESSIAWAKRTGT